MSTTPLQLLSLGQQATQQAFDRIDQSLTKTAEVAIQASKFKADVAFKAAGLAEEQRFNDFRMQQAVVENNIRAKGYELEERKMLFDMKQAETQQKLYDLDFKIKEKELEEYSQKEAINKFGVFTQQTDRLAAAKLAETGNVDLAREYEKYKQKNAASVFDGNPFDAAAYEAGAIKLLESFEAVEIDRGKYDPAFSQALGMLDPDAREIYETRSNPIYSANKNSAAYTLFEADEQQVPEIINTYRPLLNKDLGRVGVMRDRKKSNDRAIQDAERNLDRYAAMASSASTSDENKAKANELANYYFKIIEEKSQDNNRMRLNIQRGIFDVAAEAPTETTKAPETTGLPTPPDVAKFTDTNYKSPAVFGINSEKVPFEFKDAYSKLTNLLADVGAAKEIPDAVTGEKKSEYNQEASEYKGLSANWFLQFGREGRIDANTKAIARKKIRNNIDEMYGDENEAALDDRMLQTAPLILKKIETSTPIPVKESVAKALEKAGFSTASQGKNGLRDIYFRSDPKSKAEQLITFNAMQPITGVEDIRKALNSIKNQDERFNAKKEIWAAILGAGFEYALAE